MSTVKPLLLASLVIVAAIENASAQAKSPAKPEMVRYIVAPTGNEARYRVREQLVGVDLPTDAIGVTKGVVGRIVVGADGKVVKENSKFVIQLDELKSNQSRRDNFLRRSTLETSKYPTAELVPTAPRACCFHFRVWSRRKTFAVRGDLTVHGVTHTTVWQVTARGAEGDLTSSAMAATAFTFKDFAPQIAALFRSSSASLTRSGWSTTSDSFPTRRADGIFTAVSAIRTGKVDSAS